MYLAKLAQLIKCVVFLLPAVYRLALFFNQSNDLFFYARIQCVF